MSTQDTTALASEYNQLCAGVPAAKWAARKLIVFGYSADEAIEWLFSPHPQLGGATAAVMLMAGEEDAVLAVIDQLESGAYV